MIDPDFAALPLDALAEIALEQASSQGATFATLRIERRHNQMVRVRDRALAGSTNEVELGLSVQVIVDGTWGFAGSTGLTRELVLTTVARAIDAARQSRPLRFEEVVLADEPTHRGEWTSSWQIDPTTVPENEKVELLLDWSTQLLHAGADHTEAWVLAVKEILFYADSNGSRTLQQRVRVAPEFSGYLLTEDGMESMRTLAPPTARGWEYLLGEGWDWQGELAQTVPLLHEKAKAESIEPGRYDLVIDPSNLWLTIHESIGHATELDRALGYEAAYAGTSFATFDQLNRLRYGSELMNVTGDRQVDNGLATVGWDHEGVAAQSWDIVKNGVLVGYQLDRRMARMKELGRSNGCAYADSPSHIPIQRMANVSLAPSSEDRTTDQIIAGVDRGIYVVGDKSWSIDMQRFNFQFTAQRFYKIESGRIAGMVKDAAYQATTTDFWNSMTDLGGAQTWVLGGSFNCGKAQPGQVAPVSHGCPSARFNAINILNTRQESGR